MPGAVKGTFWRIVSVDALLYFKKNGRATGSRAAGAGRGVAEREGELARQEPFGVVNA